MMSFLYVLKNMIQNILQKLQKIIASFFNLFFAPQCPICYEMQETNNICLKCFNSVSFLGECCVKCQEPFEYHVPGVEICESCAGKDLSFYSSMICAMKYNEAIKNLVVRFKNQQDFSLAKLFAKWIANRYRQLHDVSGRGNGDCSGAANGAGDCNGRNLIIIPVPLYRKRLVKRGYNQSIVLARQLSKLLNAPMVNMLERVRDTNSQATKTIQERADNVKNAFVVTKKYRQVLASGRFDGKKFLIVDDVITTGATLFECAKALQSASVGRARKIELVALARRLKKGKRESIDLSNEME